MANKEDEDDTYIGICPTDYGYWVGDDLGKQSGQAGDLGPHPASLYTATGGAIQQMLRYS